VSKDSLKCNLGEEDSSPFDFHTALPGEPEWQHVHINSQEAQLPASSLLGQQCEVT